ncbi:signal recognition particle receptor subunit alpha-like [Elysia marginata]|uniref:Signal recognition particle receptor subunit alpha-like n=1 Tax=Elysia marginata TaxID=1093978 RepID=A0AAV4HI27_9GAST|nr:signal recognition particle receptor subunit alpha-like [Elysia marginata]
MLDFFTIFSKGGIVLWCFQGTSQLFTPSVNALIKSVILQERTGNNSFAHDALTLKYKLDNEFELVFVVAYQNILQLSYVDKFLTDIQLEFRQRYKDVLLGGPAIWGCHDFTGFSGPFTRALKDREDESKAEQKAGRKMRNFDESAKSKKTVSSMIENKKEEKKPAKGKENKASKIPTPEGRKPKVSPSESTPPQVNGAPLGDETSTAVNGTPASPPAGGLDEETRLKNLQKLAMRGKKKTAGGDNSKSPDSSKRKVKQMTKWDNGGSSKDVGALDFSGTTDDSAFIPTQAEQALVGKMSGQLQDIEPEDDDYDEDDFEDEEEEEVEVKQKNKTQSKSGSSGGGMFSMFRNLVGSKTLTPEDLKPVLDKMKDHLIAKNVAADIAVKLCESVSAKLEGKVLGTFGSIASTVKTTLTEACVQILSPRRRVDILRDAMDARQNKRPYVITFCGVNGVGKSTNLAKTQVLRLLRLDSSVGRGLAPWPRGRGFEPQPSTVRAPTGWVDVCFWLVENGLSVLIAACDTFRSGAVEQLRTHVRKLNALHPPSKHQGREMVQLYERGYGKDSAGIAMEAIASARDYRIDVVLVDTAGRMQDNEPLMRALTKLVKVNQPDLVLFVGEALVGNEAVDQLTKFNRALADFSQQQPPRLIDGIILTKFDTIDDKVGAAVSMTYTTGQPIVFVGTGQTYSDLRNLNARAVVTSLLRA